MLISQRILYDRYYTFSYERNFCSNTISIPYRVHLQYAESPPDSSS